MLKGAITERLNAIILLLLRLQWTFLKYAGQSQNYNF